MFGKRPTSGKTALTERVRRVGARSLTEDPLLPAAFRTHTKPRAARQPVFKNASVGLGDGVRLSVVIKDLNGEGARVEYFSRTTLPHEVVLSEPMSKLRRRAQVAWQRHGVAGLRFID